MIKGLKVFLFVLFTAVLPLSVISQNPTLVYPKNNQTVEVNPTIVWNTIDTVDSYQLVVSSAPDLSSPNLVQQVSQNRYQFSNLIGTFYWRVYALKNASFIDSSTISSFTVVDVASLDSLNLWLRSDTGISLNGNKVTAWQDLSDSMSTVGQSSLNFQPELSNDSLNGFPLVFFDNVNDWLPTDVRVNSDNYYISTVYNTLNPAPNRSKQVIRGVTGWYLGNFSGFNLTRSGGFVTGTSSNAGQFVVHSAHSINDSISNHVNNVETGSRLNTAAAPSLISIGNSLTSFNVDGNLAEVIIVNGSISDSAKSSVDQYLLDRYAPPINLGEDQQVCLFPLVLDAAANHYTSYLWSTGSTDSAISVTNSDTYYLTVTDVFNRTSVDSVIIQQNVDNAPVDLFGDTTLCVGDSLILNAGNELYTFLWSTGSDSNVIVVKSPGKYSVTVTNCLGNTSIDSLQVDFSLPTFSLGTDSSICFYDSITLTPTPVSNVTYNWTGGTSMPSLLVRNTGNYSLTLTDQFGCSFSDTVRITSDSTLSGIDLGMDTSLCEGNAIGLLQPLSNIDSYQWNTGSLDSITLITTSQKYVLTITNRGCVNSDSVNISVKGQAPLVDFTFSDTCFQDSTLLTNLTTDPSNININDWSWNFGDGGNSTLANPKYRYQTEGSYQIELIATNDSLCSGRLVKNITIEPNPVANFLFDQNCLNDSVSFTDASSISSGSINLYQWNFGSMQANNSSTLNSPKFKYNSVGAKQVELRVESNAGCVDSVQRTVVVNPSPLASFTVMDTILDDSTLLTDISSISNGFIVNRRFNPGQGGVSSDSIVKIVYPTKGNYLISLVVTSDSGCVDSVGREITIIPEPPQFNTVFPKQNQTVANGSINFIWNRIDSLMNYRLELSDDSSFTTIQSFTTRRNSFLNNNVTSGRQYWRVVGTSTLGTQDTTNVASFNLFDLRAIDSLNLWLRADTGLTITNGTITDWMDLSDSASVVDQPQLNRQPQLSNDSLNGYPLILFDAVNDRLETDVFVHSDNHYIASVYNTINPGSRRFEVIRGSLGWYMGNFSNFNLVSNGGLVQGKRSEPEQYVVHSAHSIDDSTSNHINGEQTGIRINGTSPAGITIGNTVIDGNLAEVIIIDGTINDSLRSTIDQYLLDKYSPPVDLGPDVMVCQFPDSFTFNMENAASILWSTGDTTNTLRVDSAGKYIVTVTDIFERVSVDSFYVTQDTSNFELELDFSDSTICKGSEIEIYINNSHLNYSWNTGDTLAEISVSSQGQYFVEVENCLGSLSRDTVNITVNDPAFTLGIDTIICHNEIISLAPDSNFSNVNYRWSTGETTVAVVADTSRLYSLTVTDNFGCSFRDTIDIQIDSTLFGLTLGNDTSLCTGNEIQLVNPNSFITSYSWSTGDVGMTTPVDTVGAYKVTIGNGRCLVSDTINISIQGQAPIADFNFSNLCFQDTVQFVNNSVPAVVSDTIIRWDWRFGTGDSAITNDANYRFPQRSRYRVLLAIETDKGCIDTISKPLEISPLPVANFNFPTSVICARSPILHEDSSFIGIGSIVSQTWNFDVLNGNMDTSDRRNPFFTYDSSRTYEVRLKVVSDLGCVDSIQKSLFVRPTPIPDYTVDGVCIGDPISLLEQTSFPLLDTLEYFWTIRRIGSGFNIDRRRNPVLQFSEAGDYDIGLRTRYYINSNEWCEANFKDTIRFFDSPIADFTVPLICENDSFSITNQSSPIDSIVSYSYRFNQTDSSDLPSPTFTGVAPGQYALSLAVSDTNQCTDSIEKFVQINEKPDVQFSILNNNSGIPFKVDLENTTTNAMNFLWKFGNGDSSTNVLPDYTYRDTGTYQISLLATSTLGCVDSSTQDLIALSKFIDATLSKIFLTENSLGDIEVSYQILNSGFNTINNLVLSVDLNNEFEFREQVSTNLYTQRVRSFEMDASFIPDAGRKIDFVCVRILSVNGEKDSIASNNELCELGFNNELTLNLFPNPVSDQLQLQYTLPDDGDVRLELYDALGRKQKGGFELTQQEGLYTMVINVSELSRGIYYYRFVFNGNTKTGKVFKQ